MDWRRRERRECAGRKWDGIHKECPPHLASLWLLEAGLGRWWVGERRS